MTNGNARDLPTPSTVEELTFQMVIDTILAPAGVKVGGYPQEMFLDLSSDEQHKWACNICFMMVKDCHECTNKHVFCHSCIIAWTMTSGQNSRRCPLCRCEQTTYAKNRAVDRQLEDKRVKCPRDNCWMNIAPLKVFLLHNHGRSDYSNAGIDLDALRARHFLEPLPALGGLFTADIQHLPPVARMQVLRGRVVAQQVQLVLHLAYVLRQQAITRYSAATDPVVRAQALQEVIQYSEQLNEFGGMMTVVQNPNAGSTLFGAAATATADRGRDGRISQMSSMSADVDMSQYRPTPLSLPTLGEAGSDSESSDRGVASTARIEFLQQLRQSEVSEVERPATTTSRGSSRALSGVPSTSFPAPATQLESSTAWERTPTQPDPSPASIGTPTQRRTSLSRGMPGPMTSFLSREIPTAGPSTSSPSRGIETPGTSGSLLSHAPTTPGPSASRGRDTPSPSRGTPGTPPRTLIPSRGIMPTNTSFPSFTSLSSGFLQRVQDVYNTTASTSAGHVTDTPTSTLPAVSNMSFARGSTDHNVLPTIPSETLESNQNVSTTRTEHSRRATESLHFQGRRGSRDISIGTATRRRSSHPMAVRATDSTTQPELAATSVTSGGHAVRYHLPTTSATPTRQSQHPPPRRSSGVGHDVTSTRHRTTGATSRTIALVQSGAPTRQQVVRQHAVVRRPVAPTGQAPHARPGPTNPRSSHRLLTRRNTRESWSFNPPPPPPPPPPSQPPPP